MDQFTIKRRFLSRIFFIVVASRDWIIDSAWKRSDDFHQHLYNDRDDCNHYNFRQLNSIIVVGVLSGVSTYSSRLLKAGNAVRETSFCYPSRGYLDPK